MKIMVNNILQTFKKCWFIWRFHDECRIFTNLTTSEKIMLCKLAGMIQQDFPIAAEIGSYLGASSCFIVAGLKSTGRLICIDTWENDTMSEGQRDTLKEFFHNTQRYESKIICVQGYSTEVAEKVRGNASAFDFLFIDGDHSYEGCRKDWDIYSPFVRSGGIIVFHDSGWAEGVKKVIEEDAKPRMAKTGSLPNMWWGWIR
jgi:predicted O-methyltransferase YrrM